jgi:hypothetical protein
MLMQTGATLWFSINLGPSFESRWGRKCWARFGHLKSRGARNGPVVAFGLEVQPAREQRAEGLSGLVGGSYQPASKAIEGGRNLAQNLLDAFASRPWSGGRGRDLCLQ